MKLITAIFVVATLVLIKQCQSTKEKTSGFYCPKSGETNLMATTVSYSKINNKHLPQTADEDQSYMTDSSQTSGDAYEKAENSNRVRRSQPTNTFGLLNILMNPRRYILSQVSTVEPSATTPVLEVKSKMEDNSTLMSLF
ncbi:hypothetical protein JTE90_023583 [Oedothorax gibbosus]|uniref:Uncharacterized protein n=1 Tax=Oedothorax gibbosus TaxID=931172 RepID=A0AAV6TQK7_9ARAC|nr:hypothetical protein JTE90_023583 [Oedothorax gibbosus]